MLKHPYTLIDHTADMGMELSAPTIKELFESAGEAFCDIVCDLRSIEKRETRILKIKRDSVSSLMQAFLSQLLYLFDTEHRLFSDIQVTQLASGVLEVTLKGEEIMMGRHIIKTGIKAVTHHQLTVEQRGKKWFARIIFDV